MADVLELETRRQIVALLARSPGLHLRAVAQRLDVSVSTADYHLGQLVRHGHLTVRDQGGFKAFYPAQGMDRRDRDILYVIRQEMPRRIATHLLLHPGATPRDVRQVVGVTAPTVSFHIGRMRERGLLTEEPAGRTKRLFIVDPERVASVLVTYRTSFLDDVVDRFADAWSDLHPPGTSPDG